MTIKKIQRKTGLIKVLAFGTFDLLHKGHIDYLEQAKKHGDSLYVLVACDQAVKRVKKHLPNEPENERLRNIRALPMVYEAWIGKPVHKITDYLRPIMKVKPDIICLGYDQALKEESWLREEIAKIKPTPILVRLESLRPDIYKTSLIKKRSDDRR